MNIILPDDIDRLSPRIMLIIIIILTINSKLSFSYTINYLLNDLINKILKIYIFEPIMGNNNFYIFGKGTRPEGAINCGIFREDFFDSSVVPKLAISYGFPSGHAQSSGFFATFIHEKFKNNPLIYYPLMLYSLYIPYTRLKLGCHTIQQVIVGYIYGIMFYYILEGAYKLLVNGIYYIKNRKEINKKNKILNKPIVNESDDGYISV
jgi:membrane-associated phospholipid phosphatase